MFLLAGYIVCPFSVHLLCSNFHLFQEARSLPIVCKDMNSANNQMCIFVIFTMFLWAQNEVVLAMSVRNISNHDNAKMVTSIHDSKRLSVLVITETEGFYHTAMEPAKTMIRSLAAQGNWFIKLTSDLCSSSNSMHDLKTYDVLIFLLTTGDIFSRNQEQAFQDYVERGGSVVAIHSGMATMPKWSFYTDLMGANFSGHPHVQDVKMVVHRRNNPSNWEIPNTWTTRDEIYNLAKPVVLDSVEVLVVADEGSYSGGSNGKFHPISWARTYGAIRSRVWVTTLGHTHESYVGSTDSGIIFKRHVAGGIQWAASGTRDARIRWQEMK